MGQAPTSNSLRAAVFLCMLAISSLVYIGYRSATENSFHFDDKHNIEEVNAIHMEEFSLPRIIDAAKGAELKTRPLPSATFAVDWWRGSGSPEAFIQTNIFIHVLAALTCFMLLVLLFRQMGYEYGACIIAGGVGAALWAAHPIQVQAVTYAVQRMTSMAALFVMLSMIAFLLARTSQRYRLAWWILCIVCALCGAISKESAWMVPAFFLLLEFGVVRHNGMLIRNRNLDLALLALPAGILIFIVIDIASGFGPFAEYMSTYQHRDFTLWERLLTQPRVIAFHVSQIFWPMPERFSILHDFVISTSLFKPIGTVFSLAGVAVWAGCGVALLLSQQRRVIGFLLLFPLVALVPESSIIPLEMVFEHRMYLPSVALAGLVVYPGLWLLERTSVVNFRLFATSLAGVAVFLALATFSTTVKWKDDLSLYTHALQHAPMDSRVYDALSRASRENGQMDQALRHARTAVELDPISVPALHNLGRLLHASGERREAYEMYKRALEEFPKFGPANFSLGMLYMEAGMLKEARTEFFKALEYDPSDTQAMMFLRYVDQARQQGPQPTR